MKTPFLRFIYLISLETVKLHGNFVFIMVSKITIDKY